MLADRHFLCNTGAPLISSTTMPGMHKILSESHFKEFVYGFQLSEVSPHAFLPPMHLVEKSIEGLADFALGAQSCSVSVWHGD